MDGNCKFTKKYYWLRRNLGTSDVIFLMLLFAIRLPIYFPEKIKEATPKVVNALSKNFGHLIFISFKIKALR